MDKISPITYGAAVAAAEEILGNAEGITDEVITEKNKRCSAAVCRNK